HHQPPAGPPVILRITPDGHEQLLETYTQTMGVTALRQAARAHAGAHEAIEEQDRVFQQPPDQDLHAGDLVLDARGIPYRIKSMTDWAINATALQPDNGVWKDYSYQHSFSRDNLFAKWPSLDTLP